MHDEPEDAVDDEPVWRSRSSLSRERKADETRLQELAKTLVGLSRKQLAKLPLDDELLGVVIEGQRMASHAARARQLRIVRRVLRDQDNKAVGEAVAELVNPHAGPSRAQRQAEQWATRLIDEGRTAMEAFLAEHPAADRQQLNNLARNARKAAPKKAAKARKTLRLALQACAAGEPGTG